MRYLNWDVLLFPAGSRVPIQEFKTGCYAVYDPEVFPYDTVYGRTSPRQIPIVTCFLPNQSDGTAFKVSIHSWIAPNLSEELKYMAHQGKHPSYQARVFIDGDFVAGLSMNLQTLYPRTMESSVHTGKNGLKEVLRWPSFRSEQLKQSFWNAGEDLGRIKVTIAEGYTQTPEDSPFVRTKNLVTFSFQHAPQMVLENVGIAWPNKAMWLPSSQNCFSPKNINTDDIDPDLHAHSPHRHRVWSSIEQSGLPFPSAYGSDNNRIMRPPPVPPNFYQGHDNSWENQGMINNHFLSRRSKNLTDKSDVSMSDYSPPLHPKNNNRNAVAPETQSKLSVTFAESDTTTPAFSRLLDSPTSRYDGLAAPTNTRANSITDSLLSRSTFRREADEEPVAYSQASSVSTPTVRKVTPHPRNISKFRRRSDVTMASQSSEEKDQQKELINPFQWIGAVSPKIRSRKEGKAHSLERIDDCHDHELSASTINISQGSTENITNVPQRRLASDAKRKLEAISTDTSTESLQDIVPSTSPRKTSRIDLTGGPSSSRSTDGAIETCDIHSVRTKRFPLVVLDNPNA